MYQCDKCGARFNPLAHNQHCPKCATKIRVAALWKESDDSGCTLQVGAFFGGLFILPKIRDYLFPLDSDKEEATSFFFMVLMFIIAIVASYYVPLLLIYISKYAYTQIREHHMKCPHGKTGGFYQGNCSTCRQNILQAIADYELEKQRMEEEILRKEEERKEKDRRSEIRQKAIAFNQIEKYRYSTNQLKELDHLFQLHPREFEHCVINLFNKLGYKAQITPYSNDHGKDGIAHKDGKKYLIECKRYGINKKPGRPDLQKFYAAICEENADGGYFITTSTFPDTARKYEYVESNKIILINGLELVKIINDAYPDNNETYTAMCLACGKINTFSATEIHTKQECECGNSVEFVMQDVTRMRDGMHV
jgi:restriction system protein